MINRAAAIVFVFSVTAASNAEELLDAALAAHGGLAGLERAAGSFDFEGVHYAPLQNVHADFTRNPHPVHGRVIVDGSAAAASYEEHVARAGVYTGRHRYLVRDGKAWNLNLRSRQYRPAAAPAVRQRVMRMVPHLVLLEASKQRPTIRRLPDEGRQQVFGFGSPFTTVYVDAATHLVTKIEVAVTLPLVGEKTWQYLFDDYRTIDGVVFPGRRMARLSGAQVETITYRAATWNGAEPIEVPPDYVLRDDDARRAAMRQETVDLGDGVHVIRNLRGTDSTVLAVAFDDFVLVAGAPQGVSDAAIAAVRARLPGKPIRYVVPTHHHSDHAGGVPAFIAAGATVLATPGTAALFERAEVVSRRVILSREDGQGPSGANGEGPSASTRLRMTRSVADANQRVDLIDIGPTPHAAEMLIVHLPRQRILYQGDLLELDDDDPIDEWTANEVTVTFLERLGELDLDVDRIIGTEGREATLADLRQAVALRNPQQTAGPMFTFQSNLWVNLHHFLRAVGRGQPTPGNLTAEERAAWDEVVAAYRARYMNRDVVHDPGMVAIKDQLRVVPNDGPLPEIRGEAGLKQLLERAAPIYRKHWWPGQDTLNRSWVAAVQPLVARYGREVGRRVAGAYGVAWPGEAMPVDLSINAGPNGAYTTPGPHSTISSAERGMQGLAALETLFHEASHQWGRELQRAIAQAAERRKKSVPRGLWHGVLFYNSGEATRRVLYADGITHYVEFGGGRIYEDLCGAGCRERVAKHWDARLDGTISMETAIDRIVAEWP